MKNKKRYKSLYTREFQKRDKALRNLGFESYADYLRSDLWRGIKKKVMGGYEAKMCYVCDMFVATELHHLTYETSVMRGNKPSHLYPVCEHCHEKIFEYSKRRRTNQKNATRRLMKSFGRHIRHDGRITQAGKEPIRFAKPVCPPMATRGAYRKYGVFGLQARGAL